MKEHTMSKELATKNLLGLVLIIGIALWWVKAVAKAKAEGKPTPCERIISFITGKKDIYA